MKLPNGYGSVRKLSGTRRRPYMVEKTDTWLIDKDTQKLKQKRSIIGYYATRAEALQALVDYNKQPYDITASKLTFAQVYALWSEKKYKDMPDKNTTGYKAAYKLCTALYNMPYKDIKLKDMQAVVDNSGKNTPTLRKLKTLLSQMADFAIVNEIISKDKNFVEYLNINTGNPNGRARTVFTAAEIATLWENVQYNIYLQIPLMLIYSGVRISELLQLKKCDVHLTEKWFYIAHSKTPAGVRVVPIADKTYSFFEFWYNHSTADTLLCTPDGAPLVYENYRDTYFDALLLPLNIKHLPHDTRHTCISMLAAKKVYPTTIKKIVGHAGAQTLTEKVYTHLDIQELLDAINII